MITRCALFEGSIKDGQANAFRRAVLEELVPTWQAFPGVSEVHFSVADERDENAPEVVMIPAAEYPNRAALATVAVLAIRHNHPRAERWSTPREIDGDGHGGCDRD
jgi:hypothetical protein